MAACAVVGSGVAGSGEVEASAAAKARATLAATSALNVRAGSKGEVAESAEVAASIGDGFGGSGDGFGGVVDTRRGLALGPGALAPEARRRHASSSSTAVARRRLAAVGARWCGLLRGLLAGEQPQSKLTRLEADAGAAAGEAGAAEIPGVVWAPHSAVRGGGAGGDGGVATGRGRGGATHAAAGVTNGCGGGAAAGAAAGAAVGGHACGGGAAAKYGDAAIIAGIII